MQNQPSSPADQSPTSQAVPSSPRFFFSATASNSSASGHRRIAIAVDLSDESAYAVKWAVQNYLRPGDAVILLHIRPTSALYGADWGSIDLTDPEGPTQIQESQQKMEDDLDGLTATKAQNLAQPLMEANIPYKIHIAEDHDMKERLCLEVERLGLSAVIMGSRGFGATRRTAKGRLGSVSDYCVCPVVVVRYPDELVAGEGVDKDDVTASGTTVNCGEAELHPVPEEEQEYHDAADE